MTVPEQSSFLICSRPVGGLARRAAHIPQVAHMPIRFHHRGRSNRIFVNAPLAGSPLDNLRGSAGEIAGDLVALGPPECPIVLDRPVVRRRQDRMVGLAVVGRRLPRWV